MIFSFKCDCLVSFSVSSSDIVDDFGFSISLVLGSVSLIDVLLHCAVAC